jgi:hypothetical protein
VRAAREAAFLRALERAQRDFRALRGSRAYAATLEALAREAAEAIGADLVRIDARDAALAKSLARRLSVRVEVDPALATDCGAVARDPASREARNTVEDRLARAEARLRAATAGLFRPGEDA